MITVPSMPMVSEVARSMPPLSPVVPRQMLPPPTTTASSRSPPSMAWVISPAMRSTVAASMVSSEAAEARASPDILRTIRRGCSHLRLDAQEPMTTCAKATIRADPSMPAIDCFSSLT